MKARVTAVERAVGVKRLTLTRTCHNPHCGRSFRPIWSTSFHCSEPCGAYCPHPPPPRERVTRPVTPGDPTGPVTPADGDAA